ncbi:hypothetical protein ACFVVP_33230, partial [Streptomyces sp. NPDC058128]
TGSRVPNPEPQHIRNPARSSVRGPARSRVRRQQDGKPSSAPSRPGAGTAPAKSSNTVRKPLAGPQATGSGAGAGTSPTAPRPASGTTSTTKEPSKAGAAAKGTSGPTPATKSSSPNRTSLTVPAPRTATTNPTKAPTGTTAATTKTEKTPAPGTDSGKTLAPDTKTAPAKTSNSSAETIPTKNSTTPPTPATAPAIQGPLFTRDARETGYRDGTRAARAAAKGRAYGHGVQDGWHAVMGAADQEKTLLDQARDNRATRKNPVMPPPPAVPPRPAQPPTSSTPASANLAAPTDSRGPIQVTGIDKTHIHLGDGATRDSVTRGEIRTFKGFERRLEVRHGDIGHVVEDTQHLAQYAIEQAKNIAQLQDQAKAVKSGDSSPPSPASRTPWPSRPSAPKTSTGGPYAATTRPAPASPTSACATAATTKPSSTPTRPPPQSSTSTRDNHRG